MTRLSVLVTREGTRPSPLSIVVSHTMFCGLRPRVEHVQSREWRKCATPSYMLRKGRFVPTIYLDADACPVKEQVYRVAARYGIPVSVVANAQLRLPQLAGLIAKVVVVANTPDAADDWIVE